MKAMRVLNQDGMVRILMSGSNGKWHDATGLIKQAIGDQYHTESLLDRLVAQESLRAVLDQLHEKLENAPSVRLSECSPLLPLTKGEVFCIGRNYAAHARELGNEVPSEPVIFQKPRASLIASGSSIILPKTNHDNVQYEGELVLILGNKINGHESDEEIDAAIAAITLLNDVTDRNKQSELKQKGKPWLAAKGRKTFAPCGPAIAFRDSFEDWNDLTLITRVNGEDRQNGSPAQWLWSATNLVRYLGEIIGLKAGDMIATGTPPGVGVLRPGDTVEIFCPSVGTLQSKVLLDV